MLQFVVWQWELASYSGEVGTQHATLLPIQNGPGSELHIQRGGHFS